MLHSLHGRLAGLGRVQADARVLLRPRVQGIASAADLIDARVLWRFVARDPRGRMKWVDQIENLVVNEGLNYWLDSLTADRSAVVYSIGLISATPTVAAGDTLSSHAGWTEVTAYDEATRQTLTLAAASAQSRDNNGNEAVFTISSDGTGLGGGLIATNSTKGGTTGTLFSAGAFTAGNKTLDDGDTLTVDVALSATS